MITDLASVLQSNATIVLGGQKIDVHITNVRVEYPGDTVAYEFVGPNGISGSGSVPYGQWKPGVLLHPSSVNKIYTSDSPSYSGTWGGHHSFTDPAESYDVDLSQIAADLAKLPQPKPDAPDAEIWPEVWPDKSKYALLTHGSFSGEDLKVSIVKADAAIKKLVAPVDKAAKEQEALIQSLKEVIARSLKDTQVKLFEELHNHPVHLAAGDTFSGKAYVDLPGTAGVEVTLTVEAKKAL